MISHLVIPFRRLKARPIHLDQAASDIGGIVSAAQHGTAVGDKAVAEVGFIGQPLEGEEERACQQP